MEAQNITNRIKARIDAPLPRRPQDALQQRQQQHEADRRLYAGWQRQCLSQRVIDAEAADRG